MADADEDKLVDNLRAVAWMLDRRGNKRSSETAMAAADRIEHLEDEVERTTSRQGQILVSVDRPRFTVGDQVIRPDTPIGPYLVTAVEFIEMKYTGCWAWYVYTTPPSGSGYETNFAPLPVQKEAVGG